jgi:hypothetical protein
MEMTCRSKIFVAFQQTTHWSISEDGSFHKFYTVISVLLLVFFFLIWWICVGIENKLIRFSTNGYPLLTNVFLCVQNCAQVTCARNWIS